MELPHREGKLCPRTSPPLPMKIPCDSLPTYGAMRTRAQQKEHAESPYNRNLASEQLEPLLTSPTGTKHSKTSEKAPKSPENTRIIRQKPANRENHCSIVNKAHNSEESTYRHREYEQEEQTGENREAPARPR